MANWIIDRTINLDEFKTREVLKLLLVVPRKSDSEMEKILHEKGVLKNAGDGALRRRWYTYLRNYGLLKEDDVTEMGKFYAESKLSLAELSLLQLIKKKITVGDHGLTIFPLKVIVCLLKKLSDISRDEAYITREEFINFVCLSESDENAAINSLFNDIQNARTSGAVLSWSEGQHDDIWFNTLSQTCLFDYLGRSLYVKDFEILEAIYNFYLTTIHCSFDYGVFDFEFISSIPFPTKASSTFNEREILSTKNVSNLLVDFFFNFTNIRKLEEKYYSNKKNYKGVLDFLKLCNIEPSNIGLYSNFKNYPNIIMVKFINSSDDELVVLAKIMQNFLIELEDKEMKIIDESKRIKDGKNIILYGVPGAGKSWTIKNEYCNDDNRMERLVFHPDYTYSDFVGQILPKVNDDSSVSYEFTPGPFTNLVKKAYENPEQSFFLIIEEVNRGNAPAIFGDIFQLLDRTKEGKSEYEITNSDIARIVYGDENHKVSIPSNMSILCTMNTSDQNVFTLDTAFQRRWSMRLIKNKFRDEKSEKEFAEKKILDTTVTWEHFFTEINKIILSKNIRMTSSEDKRLGTHFVSDEDLKYIEGDDKQNSRFPEKVLKYLWDDAFKFTKEDIFDLDKVKSLEDVIEIFIGSKGNERFKIFKENIYNSIVS